MRSTKFLSVVCAAALCLFLSSILYTSCSNDEDSWDDEMQTLAESQMTRGAMENDTEINVYTDNLIVMVNDHENNVSFPITCRFSGTMKKTVEDKRTTIDIYNCNIEPISKVGDVGNIHYSNVEATTGSGNAEVAGETYCRCIIHVSANYLGVKKFSDNTKRVVTGTAVYSGAPAIFDLF